MNTFSLVNYTRKFYVTGFWVFNSLEELTNGLLEDDLDENRQLFSEDDIKRVAKEIFNDRHNIIDEVFRQQKVNHKHGWLNPKNLDEFNFSW